MYADEIEIKFYINQSNISLLLFMHAIEHYYIVCQRKFSIKYMTVYWRHCYTTLKINMFIDFFIVTMYATSAMSNIRLI